jgi:hypothetical protein
MLITLISGVAVWIIGLMFRWKTSAQFSDGLFGAAAIMIIIGLYPSRGTAIVPPSWPLVDMEAVDQAKLWTADAFRGRIIMAVLGISRLLLRQEI